MTENDETLTDEEMNGGDSSTAQDQGNNLQPTKSFTSIWGWLGIFILMGWAAITMLLVQIVTLGIAWFSDVIYMGGNMQAAQIAALVGPLVAGLPLPLGLLIRGRRPRSMLYTLMLALAAAFLFILPRAIYPPYASYAPRLVRSA